MNLIKFFEEKIHVSEHLSKRENWTPMMVHIWRTALILGAVLGFLVGLAVGRVLL